MYPTPVSSALGACLAACLAAFILTAPLAGQSASRPSIAAAHRDGPISIDGRLDESASG